MEWIVLAVILLVMAPAFALPFLMSEHETMENDMRRKHVAPSVKPAVRPVLQHPANGSEISTAA